MYLLNSIAKIKKLDILGNFLIFLIQLKFVRSHRVQNGYTATPLQYEKFLEEIVWLQLETFPGKLGVFGVGTHTETALRSIPNFADRIYCFTDNNNTLWHQKKFNKPVLPPEEAVKNCDVFFLSTTIYQQTFRTDLKRLGFSGPIVAVDDHVPPFWFM